MARRDMTQGPIWRQLLVFSIPILLGNLLQQLYNAIDAMVVGLYVSKEALAAVGSSGTLINMIIAFFMGMSTGSSVLISHYCGARNGKGLHDTVHTAMLLSVVLGAVLSMVGFYLSPTLLRWMQTPEEIFPQSVEYLRIYFTGLVFLTIYNMGNAVLRAMGDSRRPLYFLALSSVLNAGLDLLFVLAFDMGIAGVAWATVLSQAVSAVLVVIVMCRTRGDDRLALRDLRLHRNIVREIVRIGLPGGLQQGIISGANLVVQTYINQLGATVVAGYSACAKLDAFIMLPAQTMAMSITTFVGQNLGARKVKRARRGVKVSMATGLIANITLAALALLFGRDFLHLFTSDPDVVEAGFAFLTVFAPTYFLLCFTQILPGALRGAGDVRMSTAICITCFVPLRQIYLYFITRAHHSIVTVALGFPLTWAIAAVALAIYYVKSDWSRHSLVPAQQTEQADCAG
ncbi:MAG TPA: MATE family efflux transporter [Clostridia bacterium]|nr:MATE family efflux transporter [Clostridia bacterium]